MVDTLPIWLTAQLCIGLYIAGVSLPYLYTYIAPKHYRKVVKCAVDRYKRLRSKRDERLQRENDMLYNNKLMLQHKYATKAVKNTTPTSYNQETSSEEDEDESSSSDTETDSEDDKNEQRVLEQYAKGMDTVIDLFDGQASTTTSASATTVIMMNNAARKKLPRKPGSAIKV